MRYTYDWSFMSLFVCHYSVKWQEKGTKSEVTVLWLSTGTNACTWQTSDRHPIQQQELDSNSRLHWSGMAWQFLLNSSACAMLIEKRKTSLIWTVMDQTYIDVEGPVRYGQRIYNMKKSDVGKWETDLKWNIEKLFDMERGETIWYGTRRNDLIWNVKKWFDMEHGKMI